MVGNIKQPPPLRDEAEVTLEGRARGSRVDLLLQMVHKQLFLGALSDERPS